MHFVKTVAVVVAGILLLAVIDGEMFVAPVRQSRVDVVLVGETVVPRAIVALRNGAIVAC